MVVGSEKDGIDSRRDFVFDGLSEESSFDLCTQEMVLTMTVTW